MREPDSNAELCSQLRDGLAADLSVSSTYVFGDLLWDPDSSFAEVEKLGGAACVERTQSPRRVVLMLVRGEIRFWLTTNSDPYASGAASGMGILPSVSAAINLCDQFIGRDVSIEQLTNPPPKIFRDV